MRRSPRLIPLFAVMATTLAVGTASAAQRVKLDPSMVTHEGSQGDPSGMVDEQDKVTGIPPTGEPSNGWTVPSQYWKTAFPTSAYIDLGADRYLSSLWLYDTNATGEVIVSCGKPDAWTDVATYDCRAYRQWVELPLNVKTRYLRITRKDSGSNFAEIALFEQTAEQFAEAQARREAESKAKAAREAAEAQARAERDAAVAVERQRVKDRPQIDLGEPFGRLTLVDEIDVAAPDAGRFFVQKPDDATGVETILGKPCRVLKKTPGEAAYMSFRIGRHKLLEPGAAYVLEVEYPEDAPRSMIVLNSGNETALGFHTGAAVGDAFHPKYVNNLNESIATPLGQQYRTWTQFFNLHDRFSNVQYVRGDGERPLTPDDGFTVTIAQFSAENLPVSSGAAVSRIRLYAVPDAARLAAQYRLPPEGLPRRHLFWREEMADNVIVADKQGQPGVATPLDWYRFKANQMQFLGMNTYTKDLLEFGAVQHWDTTAHGGNRWAYFNSRQKDLWGQIVTLMGQRGFSVLPYYEYAGSKGQQGLGNQRRAKPLTRDDAYTHIGWIESSNADITDPDTYDDFKKMLELTVVEHKSAAPFVGAWLRPRSQIPVGFGDATRARFAAEANAAQAVTRQQLRDDPKLLARYMQWWFGKRQQFVVAMRDYLREKGVDEALVLYTTAAGEPGVPFATWSPMMVCDDVPGWQKRLKASSNERDQKTEVLSVDDVVSRDLYLTALLSAPMNWGGWEVHHANPPADPQNYKQTEGVMLTHAFNRLYTVASPKTFDAFRAPSGLAVIRHFSLNENMMVDKNDAPILGYFVSDVERAGPYCMMAEAMAMANGDPRMVGYLASRSYARGFPRYVRSFNTAFLSLPALPSERLAGAASDPEVVVRTIRTKQHGTYYAIINTGMGDKAGVDIQLPAGKTINAATGEPVVAVAGKVRLSLHPFQLVALQITAN
jgi:hypothetical protein